MAQDRRVSIRTRSARPAVTAPLVSQPAGSRVLRSDRAWTALLFDAAQTTRDTVLFLSLLGAFLLILLALAGRF